MAFRTAYLIAGDAADAEEAAQDGFVKGYRALARFIPGAPFRPWILHIVANEARNRRRSRGRRLALQERAERAAVTDRGRAQDSPEDVAIAREQRAILLGALSELSADDRLVIGYRYLFGLSEAEMAETLDIPRGTVKSRLSRALARLRERVAASESEP